MCNFANENEKDRKHHLDADGGHDTVSTAGRQQEVVGMGEGCEAHPQPLPKGWEAHPRPLPKGCEAHPQPLPKGWEAHPQPLPKGWESYNDVYQDYGCHDGGEAQRIWL